MTDTVFREEGFPPMLLSRDCGDCRTNVDVVMTNPSINDTGSFNGDLDARHYRCPDCGTATTDEERLKMMRRFQSLYTGRPA